MGDKVFAADYDIEEETGWYKFPSDVQYRKELFPEFKSSEHPAKANVWLTQACIEYVSEPGETILDIFGGTGTTMVGALVGRKVILIELEKNFQDLIERHMQDLENFAPGIGGMINLLPGDTAKVLPLPGLADHVVTSPPYAAIMRSKGKDSFSQDTLGSGLADYSTHPDNVSNLNEFFYHQKMRKIYEGVFNTLPSGGTLTIIIKDHMAGGQRVYLGKRAQEDCLGLGFVEHSWFKWKAPGSAYLAVHRSHGLEVVDDEDIIIMRKP